MSKVLTAVVALVVGVVIGAAVVTASKSSLGGLTIENETFANDVTINDDLILNASTFCVDFYATSTATRVKMVASSTVGQANPGLVAYAYGSCQ